MLEKKKKKRILQKAEIRKHHNYLWVYKKWIHTVLAFFRLQKIRLKVLNSSAVVKCAEKSTSELKAAKTVWIHFL